VFPLVAPNRKIFLKREKKKKQDNQEEDRGHCDTEIEKK
jgi:hypothetical protein